MYTLIIKNENGSSDDYRTINDDEYKAIVHICGNGIPNCKGCLHHHMTRDDRCDNLRMETEDDFFCGYFEPVEEED